LVSGILRLLGFVATLRSTCWLAIQRALTVCSFTTGSILSHDQKDEEQQGDPKQTQPAIQAAVDMKRLARI
jgi:hypothetical protein